MAILDDKKWNILHIQNSFIVDPSGTCDLIHPRDQLTLEQLAELKNNDEAYDRWTGCPNYRITRNNSKTQKDRNLLAVIIELQKRKFTKDRILWKPRKALQKLDQMLMIETVDQDAILTSCWGKSFLESVENKQNFSETGRPNKQSNRAKQLESKPRLLLPVAQRKGPLTPAEVRERLALRSQQSVEASQKIIEEKPEDTRPFAEYQKYEVMNPNMRQKSYNVQLFQQKGLQRTQLLFDNEHYSLRISIKEDVQFKHLIGLACFR